MAIDFSKPDTALALTKTMIDNSPVGYVILDKNFRIQYANKYFAKLRGLASDPIYGTRCHSLWGYDIPCPGCSTRETLATGQRTFSFHKDVIDHDTVRYVEEYSIPLLDADGDFDYILVVLVDRTNEFELRKTNNTVFLKNVELLAAILDKKDPYTSTHSADVTEISVKLARFIGLLDEDIKEIRLASLLHDIGKLYIPDRIINKPNVLTSDERSEMMRHAEKTFTMLNGLTFFDTIKEIAGSHHERWDGQGYPAARKKEEIPLGGRIIAIADSYDAMTSDRSYRRAMSHDKALHEIAANAGTQFDPHLARDFVEMCSRFHPNRSALLEKSPDRYSLAIDTHVTDDRRLKMPKKEIADEIARDKIDTMMASDLFLKRIIDNTPAYYLILDYELNILYASDNFAINIGIDKDRLRTMRCHEIDGENMSCFKMLGSDIACPVVRAMKKQTVQHGFISGRFKRNPDYCEIYAVPTTIMDQNGEPVDCCLEILFDISMEMAERQAMDNDIKILLNHVCGLVSDLESTTTHKAEEILRDCQDFNQYLNEMRLLLEEKAGITDDKTVRPKKRPENRHASQ